jgi:diguanylate cyclase (GGDEF)-like protein/PAS domain S-box-containing protein
VCWANELWGNRVRAFSGRLAGAWLAVGSKAKPAILKLDFGIDLETVPKISFVDIFKNGVPENFVKGKNVVVGLVAERVTQPVLVPRYGKVERAEFIVLAAETEILGTEPKPASFWLVISSTALGVVIFGLVLPRLGMYSGGALVLAAMSLSFVGSIELLRQTGISLPLTFSFAALILTYVGTLVACHPDFQTLRRAGLSLVDKVDYGLARLFHSGVDAIITFSPDGRILTVNETAEKLFGVPADQVLGKQLSTVLPDSAEALLKSACGNQPGRLEATLANSGGDRHLDLAFNAMPSESSWVGYASIRDITVMKDREEDLKRQASHDAMTGLPNRAAFERHLEATLRFAAETGRPFAVFVMDLNKFKQVNDTLGHQIGDALLVEVAKRFEGTLRSSDFVARLGGDEFTVVMAPPTTRDSAESMALRLVESIAELTELDGHAIETGTSVGVALYPDHGQTSEDLIRAADEAMYSAKRDGDGYGIAGDVAVLES